MPLARNIYDIPVAVRILRLRTKLAILTCILLNYMRMEKENNVWFNHIESKRNEVRKEKA